MSKTLGRALTAVSCVVLLHAAFSTYECEYSGFVTDSAPESLNVSVLSTLKALNVTKAAKTSLPTSIVLEALIALLLFIPGTTLAASPLRDVTYRGELATRTVDTSDARMGFIRLSQRGKSLFGDSIPQGTIAK